MNGLRGSTGLRPWDVVGLATAGLRSGPLRAVLSALGIAIGIAAMVAVIGISSSGRAELDRELDRLGTDLLTVSPGTDLFGDAATLPPQAPAMISRIRPVRDVSAIGSVDAKAYRNDLIPKHATGGIGVYAADLDLLRTTGATMARGAWLNAATARHPVVVLGARTARQLGIARPGPDVRILLSDSWFTVSGILDPVSLAPELDTAALVGWTVAQQRLGSDGLPTTVFTRSDDDSVESVRSVLAATANPAAPNEVKVSRPSEALEAQAAADKAFTGLLLGLGAVALLVGGVGVANTMIISVLERRAEIGLRRSLGATRGHIRTQFLGESLILSLAGGITGIVLGVIATAIFSAIRGWPTLVPIWASAGGVAATVVLGVIAGLYPATRAARLSPAAALAAPSTL